MFVEQPLASPGSANNADEGAGSLYKMGEKLQPGMGHQTGFEAVKMVSR